ncbi:D-alanyl-D-alanine carboxypeptidase [Phycicoccus sp.]|mgnify:CR=1 FL=1|uniref:D-alanyl-D-alanine carboxypeptidase/D-alanyl-D-alanine-endopeptidase n=1 Tax=Phycicoccus sp. TaxID=1902410 RepID=UPI002B927F21|nr:D-alanyl-D-alanine carboxypeptidase [Phycicoccus sp.]HMM95243.1 D-alanyl-D-alanine carboxypeptidase [Phycicoccus sp.]
MTLHRRPATVLLSLLTAMALTVLLGQPGASARPLPGTRPPEPYVWGPNVADQRMVAMLTARAASSTFGAGFSGVVIDAGTNKVLWGRNASTALMPASNTKLVTAQNALSALGPDTRYTTTVQQGATPDVVVVHGVGDPTLSSAMLDSMAASTAAALRSSGQPRAQIYIDDSVFPAPTLAGGWLSSYVPSSFTPLRGLVRDQRDVADTSADVGVYFATRLQAQGITSHYRGRTQVAATAPVIASAAGSPVSTMVQRMLISSDNEIAEALGRLVALKLGYAATWSGGRVGQHVQMTRSGLAMTTLYDSSGLSRADRMSAVQLARIVDAAVDPARPQLAAITGPWALPTSGRTGTLSASSGRFTTAPSSCAAGLVRAKTGTLSDVVALSGYTVGADGRTKVFSFLVNGKRSSLALQRAVDGLAATITGCW